MFSRKCACTSHIRPGGFVHSNDRQNMIHNDASGTQTHLLKSLSSQFLLRLPLSCSWLPTSLIARCIYGGKGRVECQNYESSVFALFLKWRPLDVLPPICDLFWRMWCFFLSYFKSTICESQGISDPRTCMAVKPTVCCCKPKICGSQFKKWFKETTIGLTMT